MSSDDDWPRPLEGQLIWAARKALGMSQRFAAPRAFMNHKQWWEYEQGWRVRDRKRDGGTKVRERVSMSTDVLVRMARVVGLKSTDLWVVRPDAARILAREEPDTRQDVGQLLETILDVFGPDTFTVALEHVIQARKASDYPGLKKAM